MRSLMAVEPLQARMDAARPLKNGRSMNDDAAPPWELPSLDSYRDEPNAGDVGPTSTPNTANEPATVPLLALLWFATLQQIVRQDHLVRDLLLMASLFVVFGESNSGKTFWLIDLCLAVAAGTRWRGRLTRKGLVIYVAGEGAASVRMRVTAYRLAHPEIDAGLPFAIVPLAVDFLSPDSIAALIATVRAAESECGEKAVLIVIDTFARAIPGGNENDAQDVGVAVMGADRIRAEVDCCVGFVHHAGKDPAKGARGSSALRAAVDTEIFIDSSKDQRNATVTKQRDLMAGQPMAFELIPQPVGQHEDGADITSCVVKQINTEETAQAPAVVELRSKHQRTFVAALRARAESTPGIAWTLMEMRQVARELGMGKSTARSVVDAIAATTYVRPTIGGYRFTDGRVEG
jgi:AAA domain